MFLLEVVAKVYNTITTDPLHAARSVYHNLDAPKTALLQILRSVLLMFPYRFQRIPVLERGDKAIACRFCEIFPHQV